MKEAVQDPRPMFEIIEADADKEAAFTAPIERVANHAAYKVDLDTIAMFKARGIPLPARLLRIDRTRSG